MLFLHTNGTVAYYSKIKSPPSVDTKYVVDGVTMSDIYSTKHSNLVDYTPHHAIGFGSSVASVGDLDADQIVDLVIGAPVGHPGVGNGVQHGVAWIILLHSDGTIKSASTVVSSPPLALLAQNTKTPIPPQPTRSLKVQASDCFCGSVALIGDVDGDGVVDIAVSAPGGSHRGAIWILFLHTNGTVKSHSKISSSDSTSSKSETS